MAMSMGFATASYVNLTNYLNPAKKKKHIFLQNSCVAVPQLERCFRGARFLSGGGQKLLLFSTIRACWAVLFWKLETF